MIKLIAFDWNATLFADTTACWEADSQMFKKLGYKPISLNQFRKTFTIPVIDFYVANGCDKEKLLKNSKQNAKFFHQLYEKRAAKCRTRRGAKKLLQWLEQQNINSIILSNHIEESIEMQLTRLKIKKYISQILANTKLDNAMKNRMKLEKLQHYIKQNNYNPRSVISIGDSPEEVEIGKAIGAITVGLTGGFYSTARLKASKPDYLIGNLGELVGIIKKVKKN